jgi:hypothetical protein
MLARSPLFLSTTCPVNIQELIQDADIFGALEKLANLKDKGILTDSEYSAKKAELLARL